jgi:hypothetical protein
MLQSWVAKRLVPAPRRAGRTGWVHAEPDVAYVVAACRLRTTVRSLDARRVHLWLDGFDQRPEDVRASLVTIMKRIDSALRREVDGTLARLGMSADDPGASSAVCAALAGALASKRGKNALPRFARQPLRGRVTGIEYLLRLFIFGEANQDAETEAKAAEKVMGVSAGRRRLRGIGPWLTGPASVMASAARVMSLPALVAAAATATDDELTAAREAVHSLRAFPKIVRLLAAWTNEDNPVGWGGLRLLPSDETVLPLLLLAVLSLRRAMPDNVQAVVGALDDVVHDAGPHVDELLHLSDSDFAARTKNVSAADAAALTRVRDEFRRTTRRGAP